MKTSSAMLGAAAFFAAGLLVTHHFLKPKDVIVYKEAESAKVDTQRDAVAESAQAAKATEAVAALSKSEKRGRWRKKVVEKPTGEKVTTETTEIDEATLSAMAEQRASELVAMARDEFREQARAEVAREINLRVRPEPLPRLSIGGGVTGNGADPDGGYISGGLRLFGPLWVKAQLARINRSEGVEYRWTLGGEAQF